jgi:hypothetical protein
MSKRVFMASQPAETNVAVPRPSDGDHRRAFTRPALSRRFARALALVYRIPIRRATQQILEGRCLDLDHPERGRWQRRDVSAYRNAVWKRVDELLPEARLHELPTYGNRHNVFLAVVTTAAYQVLIERGVNGRYAMILTADVGWKIYAWMLRIAALPARLMTRDPHQQVERTLRALMVFPFSSPGAPGYAVRAWSEGDRFFTHWTHCPPQSFVRRLVQARGDHGELDAFYHSWCLYDWPGADILAGDTSVPHYARPQTMSRGDSVCDMCWWGGSHAPRVEAQGPTAPSRGGPT